jgi:hypothetical protein
MTRQEALGRLLELMEYFDGRFAEAPMESEEEAEAYKHARAVRAAIALLSQEEADAEKGESRDDGQADPRNAG